MRGPDCAGWPVRMVSLSGTVATRQMNEQPIRRFTLLVLLLFAYGGKSGRARMPCPDSG